MAKDLRQEFLKVLASNGIMGIAPSSIHSWRCEYPDQYGPCQCVEDLLDDLMAVVQQPLETPHDGRSAAGED